MAVPPAVLTSVPELLHRLEAADYLGHPPSTVRNMDYGIDDLGETIVPTPTWQFTQFALSLVLPTYANHLYTRSDLREGRCFQFTSPGYGLPKGLGLAYDGKVRLKCWNNGEDRKEKQSGRSQYHDHYSLFVTEKMPESDLLARLATVFSMPHVMPCRVRAAAQPVNLSSFLESKPQILRDGPVLTIINAAEFFFPQIAACNPSLALDIGALHTFLTEDATSFEQVVESGFWARTAFHLLGLAESKVTSNSAGTRYLGVRDLIADRLGWDADLEYGYVPDSRDVKRVPLVDTRNSSDLKAKVLDFYKAQGAISVAIAPRHSLWVFVAFDGTTLDIPALQVTVDGTVHKAEVNKRVTIENQLGVCQPETNFDRVIAITLTVIKDTADKLGHLQKRAWRS
ncbi:hypothetical protein HDU87_005174 [Geranomyces variabilis]|uniref:Uncharacterized protein n=1 Tax=Geranomyces variabilis TaxID=109894 RepID=A0AAD5THN9_9FUNG|nr:hypothetical protein HDU87_005174 [Geranomyces variabilis]